MACTIFNAKGSNFVSLGQISNERVAMRTGTILNLVLKFQVYRSCYYGDKARARKKAGKWKKKKKEKERLEHSQ